MAWLVEGHWSVYLLLGLAALACLYFWLQSRARKLLIGAALLVLGMGLFFVVDWLVESDREQIVRKVKQMAGAVAARDVDRIFAEIADDFKAGDVTRGILRAQSEAALRTGKVTEVQVWDFEKPRIFTSAEYGKTRADEPGLQSMLTRGHIGEVFFKFKPKGNLAGDVAFFHCRAVFVRESDGQWRMITAEVYGPVNREPIPLRY